MSQQQTDPHAWTGLLHSAQPDSKRAELIFLSGQAMVYHLSVYTPFSLDNFIERILGEGVGVGVGIAFRYEPF